MNEAKVSIITTEFQISLRHSTEISREQLLELLENLSLDGENLIVSNIALLRSTKHYA